ncbi:MAG: hypothetical protein DME23_17395 [Verrucomicrobia bacterium]|nr:MAG: hypothetical protein DME23_17395 [Verrucomicrobiota bacterium]
MSSRIASFAETAFVPKLESAKMAHCRSPTSGDLRNGTIAGTHSDGLVEMTDNIFMAPICTRMFVSLRARTATGTALAAYGPSSVVKSECSYHVSTSLLSANAETSQSIGSPLILIKAA